MIAVTVWCLDHVPGTMQHCAQTNCLTIEKPDEVGSVISPTVQMWKLGHREVKQDSRGHTVLQQQSQDLNADSLAPEALLFLIP